MGSKELKSGIKIKHFILTIINKLKIGEQLDSRVLSFRLLGLSSASLMWNISEFGLPLFAVNLV
jgi:hypothetical protein